MQHYEFRRQTYVSTTSGYGDTKRLVVNVRVPKLGSCHVTSYDAIRSGVPGSDVTGYDVM